MTSKRGSGRSENSRVPGMMPGHRAAVPTPAPTARRGRPRTYLDRLPENELCLEDRLE